jgi:dienelactone hydrolase
LATTVTIALSVLATSCSATPKASAPGFAHAGPYSVGATTLDLGSAGPAFGERLATVFYPADASRLAGHARFSYDLEAPLPQALRAIVPPKYDSTVVVDAHVGAPASPHGPFPIVLFSHGFGASRLYYSNLLTGIASWGFVVVSADYLERGLLAQATHPDVRSTPARDLETMFSSLTATEAASASRTSSLHGVADSHKVAAVGHSAGGQTAFDALKDRRVDVAVGWAPVGPTGTPSKKPSMIIGALGDIALTPATLTREFKAFPGPTNFVEVSGEGHDTYTDICTSIRSGVGGLVGFAESVHFISPQLAKLANSGCAATDLAPQRFWPIVQYYTVAELRSGLGIDRSGAGLGPASAGQFKGFVITYRQHQ